MTHDIPKIGPMADLINAALGREHLFGFLPMVDVLPPTSTDAIAIEHFEVSPEEAQVAALRAQFSGDARGVIPPGRYVRLMVNLDPGSPHHDADLGATVERAIMMSDTPAERAEAKRALDNLHGNVLITGLGLGMLPHALLSRNDNTVDHVLVVEKDPDVIDIVGDALHTRHGFDRLHIVQADARTWNPSVWEFDTAFFDIWPKIGSHMLEEIDAMHAHYGPSITGWREGWVEHDLRLSESIMDLILAAGEAGNADLLKAFGWVAAQMHAAQQAI